MMRRLLLILALVLAVEWPAAAQQLDVAAVVSSLQAKGDAAVAAYNPSRKAAAADAFSDLYFDDFEGSGLENALGAVDSGFKSGVEAKFGQLVGLAQHGGASPDVAAAWADLRGQLDTAAVKLGVGRSGGNGFWTTLLESFLILVREGFEAMLVVTALLAYLRRAGARDKTMVVYQGVGLAVVASLLVAWATSTLIDLSGQGREVMEGGTMLLASLVLFYCSYWLFAKREAARWQSYVQQKVNEALTGGRLFTLGFAAFLAVFREGAETVLFYQALAAGSPGQMPALLTGLAGAVVALGGIYFAMHVLSVRLPLGLFFAATAGLLYYLAVSFAGNGIVELQNGRAVSITPLADWPSVGWLGVFPTAEGMAAQAVLVVPLVLALAWWAWKRNASRKVSRT
jgi:high-affinity iron transporter